MLDPGLELKSKGSAWRKFKGFFDTKTTKYIYVPERYGLPCGKSIIFNLVE